MIKYIVIGVIVVILLFILVVFNGIVKLNNKVKEAFATMDVYLKQRWDLIPNIVETVKGYVEYEKETLESVISIRNKAYDTMSTTEKIKTNTELNQGLSNLIALKESYPDLKASPTFKTLLDQLISIEDAIANSRKYYNGSVRMFNDRVETFPNNIIAKLFRFKPKEMFSAQAQEKENIKVEL